MFLPRDYSLKTLVMNESRGRNCAFIMTLSIITQGANIQVIVLFINYIITCKLYK